LAALRGGQQQDALQTILKLLDMTQNAKPFDYIQKQQGGGIGGGISQGISNISPKAMQGLFQGGQDLFAKGVSMYQNRGLQNLASGIKG
jgi:hypothetical protein